MPKPEKSIDKENLTVQMRQRRNLAAGFLAVALASGGALGIHEVRNHGKADFLTGVGALLVGGNLGYASGHFKHYRALRHKQDHESR